MNPVTLRIDLFRNLLVASLDIQQDFHLLPHSLEQSLTLVVSQCVAQVLEVITTITSHYQLIVTETSRRHIVALDRL